MGWLCINCIEIVLIVTILINLLTIFLQIKSYHYALDIIKLQETK